MTWLARVVLNGAGYAERGIAIEGLFQLSGHGQAGLRSMQAAQAG
jgi:hypothetical protein